MKYVVTPSTGVVAVTSNPNRRNWSSFGRGMRTRGSARRSGTAESNGDHFFMERAVEGGTMSFARR